MVATQPNLKGVILNSCSLDDTFLEAWQISSASAQPHKSDIKELSLANNPSITDISVHNLIKVLETMPQIEQLDLSGTSISQGSKDDIETRINKNRLWGTQLSVS